MAERGRGWSRFRRLARGGGTDEAPASDAPAADAEDAAEAAPTAPPPPPVVTPPLAPEDDREAWAAEADEAAEVEGDAGSAAADAAAPGDSADGEDAETAAPVVPVEPATPTWRLAEAEERNRAYPRSFFIPTSEARSALQVGERVALLFYPTSTVPDGPEAERLWVEVTELVQGAYLGRMLSRPTLIGGLATGDELAFGPEHVIRVEDTRWAPFERLVAFVNARLLDDDTLEPAFVVHDPSDADQPIEPGGPNASGWQLLVGDETQDELDDPSALRTPALNWLMERYPAFGALVFSGATDGEWHLDRDAARFVPDAD